MKEVFIKMQLISKTEAYNILKNEGGIIEIGIVPGLDSPDEVLFYYGFYTDLNCIMDYWNSVKMSEEGLKQKLFERWEKYKLMKLVTATGGSTVSLINVADAPEER